VTSPAAARQEAPERPGVWRTFRDSPLAAKTLLCGVIVNRLSAFLMVFMVLFVQSKGYSSAQAILAVGVYGGGAIAGSFIGGALADRGDKRAIVLSMASAGVLTASLPFLPTYELLLAAVALASLCAQVFRPASATMLSRLTREDRQVMIFAMFRFGLNVGATAAPLIGYALYDLGGHQYTLLFFGEALVALAYALLAWTTLPVGTRLQEPVEQAPAEPRGGYLVVLRDGRYMLYLLANLVASAVYVQYLSTLPLDVSAARVDVVWYTLAVSLNGFIVITFELLLTKLTQRWPRRFTIASGRALIAAGMAVYGLPIGPLTIIAGTMVWSLGEIISGPAIFSYPAVAGPRQLKGRYIGSFQVTSGLGQAIGPVAGGWLFLTSGALAWPLVAAGGLAACLLVLVAVRSPAPAQTPAAAARS
jgi:predicted MFS family arabinose efflux permease